MQCTSLAERTLALDRSLLPFGEIGRASIERSRQKRAAQQKSYASIAVGQKPEVPDLDESRGQDMQQEATNEFDGIQRHEFLLIATEVRSHDLVFFRIFAQS